MARRRPRRQSRAIAANTSVHDPMQTPSEEEITRACRQVASGKPIHFSCALTLNGRYCFGLYDCLSFASMQCLCHAIQSKGNASFIYRTDIQPLFNIHFSARLWTSAKCSYRRNPGSLLRLDEHLYSRSQLIPKGFKLV